jgi:hypothetical protein
MEGSSRLPRRTDSKTCPTCNRTFQKPAHLLRHISTHVGGRPFPCASCDRAFSRADALGRHQRTVHREDADVVNTDGGGGSAAGRDCDPSLDGDGGAREASDQPDDISVVGPPSGQADTTRIRGASTGLGSTEEAAFDHDLDGAAELSTITAAVPGLTTSIPAQRSTLSEHSRQHGLQQVTSTFAEQDWTWPREASPYVAPPGGEAPPANPYPIMPAGSGVAPSPLSALIDLLYDSDTIFDAHFDTLLGSWYQPDNGSNIQPMAGKLECYTGEVITRVARPEDLLSPDQAHRSAEAIPPPNAFPHEDVHGSTYIASAPRPIPSFATENITLPFGSVASPSVNGEEGTHKEAPGRLPPWQFPGHASRRPSVQRGADSEHRWIDPRRATATAASRTTTVNSFRASPPLERWSRQEPDEMPQTTNVGTSPQSIVHELDLHAVRSV